MPHSIRRVLVPLAVTACTLGTTFLSSPPATASPAPAATSVPTFIWSGADSAAGTDRDWSDGGNWQGGVAPAPGAPVDLAFPALTCVAKGKCGQVSVNDMAGMVVDRLTIVTAAVTGSGPVPPNYVISGDALALEGGIRATGTASTRFPTAPSLAVPLVVRGAQTWVVRTTSLYLDDLVSGGASDLLVYLGGGADILMTGGAHLGSLAMVGTHATHAGVDAGHNGQLYVPADEPFTVRGQVSVTDASAYFGGHLGALTTAGALLPLGGTSPPDEGVLGRTAPSPSTGRATCRSRPSSPTDRHTPSPGSTTPRSGRRARWPWGASRPSSPPAAPSPSGPSTPWSPPGAASRGR